MGITLKSIVIAAVILLLLPLALLTALVVHMVKRTAVFCHLHRHHTDTYSQLDIIDVESCSH